MDLPNNVAVYMNDTWASIPRGSAAFPMCVKQLITPQFAKAVLTSRNTQNRRVKKHRVQKFAKDIIAGRWRITNQGIGFDANGVLADGQNRLEAVVQANIAVPMIVMYGMELDARTVIDDVKARSDFDNHVLGGGELGQRHVTLMNYILEVKKQQNATKFEKQAFYDLHAEAAQFAVAAISRKYLCKAPILAVVARAYYTVDEADLSRFCQVIENGQMVSPADEAAWRLRELALDTKDENTGPARIALYRKTVRALELFLAGTPTKRLTECKKEDELGMFPLPEEVAEPSAV